MSPLLYEESGEDVAEFSWKMKKTEAQEGEVTSQIQPVTYMAPTPMILLEVLCKL